MRQETTDVVVVGGGLAGLAAAAYLARGGRRVTVFESGELGGRAATHQQDGFQLNLGPHALYCAGAGRPVLAELDVSYTGAPPAGGGLALLGGRTHLLPRDPASLLTSSLLGLGAKAEVGSLYAALPKLDARRWNNVSVRDWLDSTLRHPEARLLMEAMCRLSTYAHAPEVQSAGAVIAQLQMGAAGGVWYLDGGWQSLVAGLAQRAREAGARIVSGTRVRRVRHDAAVRGVELADGTEVEAGQVLITARPPVAATLVNAGATPLSEWAAAALPARIACLDVALHHLSRPETTFALGMDQPLYYSVHTAAARLAPKGGAVIHVARYLGTEAPADPAALEEELEGVLDQLQPGWRNVLAHRRYLPNMIASNAVDRADRGGLAGRPDVAVPGVENLFVAGDWVGPEAMLVDASLASARRAARLMLAAPVEEARLAGAVC